MNELLMIIAAIPLLWGILWFCFKLWLLGKGIQLGGMAMEYYGRKLSEMDECDSEERPFESHRDLFSGRAPEGYGRHISEHRPVHSGKSPHRPFEVIRGGKR